MGVKLLGKIKIHEIAKKLDLTSKELIEKAKALGIEVKNHLSSVDEDIVTKIKNNLKKGNKKEETKDDKKTKRDKNETPVIIRREVIINEEEAKKNVTEEKTKENHNKKELGFVERKQNKDFFF